MRDKERELTNRIERWVGAVRFSFLSSLACPCPCLQAPLVVCLFVPCTDPTHTPGQHHTTQPDGCRGFRSSRLYISLKWGCDHRQKQCAYQRPFNDPALPLSYWRLDWSRQVDVLLLLASCLIRIVLPAASPPALSHRRSTAPTRNETGGSASTARSGGPAGVATRWTGPLGPCPTRPWTTRPGSGNGCGATGPGDLDWGGGQRVWMCK